MRVILGHVLLSFKEVENAILVLFELVYVHVVEVVAKATTSLLWLGSCTWTYDGCSCHVKPSLTPFVELSLPIFLNLPCDLHLAPFPLITLSLASQLDWQPLHIFNEGGMA